MDKKRDWVSLLLSGGIIGTPILVVALTFFGGNRHLEKVQTSIRTGMTIEEVEKVFGKPTQVLSRGERFRGAHASSKRPPLDEHTAVHVYARDGIPYYNVYVFIDKHQSTVVRSEIENLWW